MTDLAPFDPDRDFDAIADFVRIEVAKVAARVVKHGAYKRATKADQAQDYIAGMMVGALGAIVAATEPGGDAETRAILRKHFDYWFDRGLEMNGRGALGELQ